MISPSDMNVLGHANVMTIWKSAINQQGNVFQVVYLDGKEKTVPSVSNKALFFILFFSNHFLLSQLLKPGLSTNDVCVKKDILYD